MFFFSILYTIGLHRSLYHLTIEEKIMVIFKEYPNAFKTLDVNSISEINNLCVDSDNNDNTIVPCRL